MSFGNSPRFFSAHSPGSLVACQILPVRHTIIVLFCVKQAPVIFYLKSPILAQVYLFSLYSRADSQFSPDRKQQTGVFPAKKAAVENSRADSQFSPG